MHLSRHSSRRIFRRGSTMRANSSLRLTKKSDCVTVPSESGGITFIFALRRYRGCLYRCIAKNIRWERDGKAWVKPTKAVIFAGSKMKQEKGSGSRPAPKSLRTAEPTAFPRFFAPFARFFADLCWLCTLWVNLPVLRNSPGYARKKRRNYKPFPVGQGNFKKGIF